MTRMSQEIKVGDHGYVGESQRVHKIVEVQGDRLKVQPITADIAVPGRPYTIAASVWHRIDDPPRKIPPKRKHDVRELPRHKLTGLRGR